MKLVFIHNRDDKASVELLEQVLTAYPDTEVLDFMLARERVWFQGTPTVIVLQDSASILSNDAVAAKREIDVTIDDVQALMQSAKVLHINPTIVPIPFGVETAINITATYLADGQPALLPDIVRVKIAGAMALADEQGRVLFTSHTAGMFEIACEAEDCLAARLEVEVQ